LAAFHGPRTITGNNQVTLPAELMAVARLKKGDDVYVRIEDQSVGTLLIVPGRVVDEGVETVLGAAHGSVSRRRKAR
jgi:bifunctional DNA-binding transcriptional regulator/antitoxin component of YhaV-PrlF toxin-antitoxin module